MPDQLPSIGRVVNYTNLGDKDGKYPPEIQAAIITGVYKDMYPGKELLESANKLGDKPNCQWVDLKVFYRSGFFDMRKVPFSHASERGHWNWPARV